MTDERHDAAFVVGAIVGGVAGAVYALFNARWAGARTRAELAERWHDGLERAAQGVAALDERMRQLTGDDDDPLLRATGAGSAAAPPLLGGGETPEAKELAPDRPLGTPRADEQPIVPL